MNLFYQPLIPQGILHLDAEESKHCIRVLRKNKGDTIRVTDGKGLFYNVTITNANTQKCEFEITETVPEAVNNFYVHIAISPTKNNERIEWFVEKAVEIGINEITFVDCKNTERPYLKADRLEKVAVSAMKQSLKASYPKLNSLTKLQDVIAKSSEASKFIAYVDQSNPDHLKTLAPQSSTYLTLIGPEGDFTKEELNLALQYNFQKVSLGKSRLRTETAGIAACHILNLLND